MNKSSLLVTEADPTNDSERLCRRYLAAVPSRVRGLNIYPLNPYSPLAGAFSWRCWLPPSFFGPPWTQAKKTLKQWDTGTWRGSYQYAWKLSPKVTSQKKGTGMGYWRCLPQVQDFFLSYLKHLVWSHSLSSFHYSFIHLINIYTEFLLLDQEANSIFWTIYWLL